MSSIICFNLQQSKILSSGNGLKVTVTVVMRDSARRKVETTGAPPGSPSAWCIALSHWTLVKSLI